MFSRLGKSRVTVEYNLSVFLIINGPSKWGINLATQLVSPAFKTRQRCNVDRTTLSLILKGKVSNLFLLDWNACEIFAEMRLSCASAIVDCILVTRLLASCSVDMLVVEGNSGGSKQGEQLKRSWKGVNPVEWLVVFMMSNLIFGNALTQPFWLRSTAYCMHCITVLLVHSLLPSVSG